MNYIPRLIAHRGASAAAPENTLPAVELAWKEGADGVEVDVRMTADSKIVCVHDVDMKRVAGKPLVVAEQNLEALQQLDVGSWKGPEFKDTRILLLSELLEKMPGGKHLFIEVKVDVEIVPALLETIDQSNIELRQVTVMAFDIEVLKKLKQKRPELKVLWLVEGKSNWLGRSNLKIEDIMETLIQTKVDGLGIESHKGITREMAKAVLGAGLKLNIWTVDKPAEAQRYATFAVSSITSNQPALILNALR